MPKFELNPQPKKCIPFLGKGWSVCSGLPWSVWPVYTLREGLNDESIADILCQNCPTEYLEELMNQDYSGFLTELQSVDGGLVDNICTNLSIDLFPPPPNPPLDDQQKVDSITTNSTISNTTSEIETIGFDCSTIETVMGNLIGFNTSTTQSFFDDVSGFKTCIRNNIADSTLNGYLRDYYGNKFLWDQVLAHAPGAEGDLVSDVRRAESAAFLSNAVDLLGQPKMDEMVQEFTGTSISHWLQTIQTHFGGNYYNTLVQALIEDHNTSFWNYSLDEQHIYGSSRLGVKTRDLLLYEQIQESGTSNYVSTEGDSLIKFTYNDSIKFQYRGATQYELSNHLGNVLVTITDRKIQTCGADEVSYYTAQIVTTSDYYPFGMQMHNRTATNEGKAYRFGFNGKENDDEVSGSGNTVAFEARIYDSRLGRFFSTDPLEARYAWQSPYLFANNSPIFLIDWLGLEGETPQHGESRMEEGWEAPEYFDERVGESGSWVDYNPLEMDAEAALAYTNSTTRFERQAHKMKDEYNARMQGRGPRFSVLYEGEGGSRSAVLVAPFGNMLGIDESTRIYEEDYPDVGAAEGAIPVWGEGKQAVYAMQDGDYASAALHGIMAVSDLSGGKTLVAGAFKLTLGRVGKAGLRGAVDNVTLKASNTTADVLSPDEIVRIRNAAQRINKPITVVGSRAKGTANAYSDWDYVIEGGLNSKQWSKIKNSLPGSKDALNNTKRNIDIFTGSPTETLPSITIYQF